MSVILRQLSCVTQFHAGNGRTYLLPVSSCKNLQNNCRSLSMTESSLRVDRNDKPDITPPRTLQTADKVVHQITQKLDETQQFSLDKENLLVFCQSLLDLRCPSEDIVQMFLNSDKILKMTVETWNKTLWFYDTLGFRKRNLLMMIDAIPVLSKQQQKVIPEIINTLRMHDFGEYYLFSINNSLDIYVNVIHMSYLFLDNYPIKINYWSVLARVLARI